MIFPDSDYLKNYKNSNFGSVISTMQFQSIIGDSTFELGDSQTYVKFEPVGKGEPGREAFKRNCRKVREAIDLALPAMKGKEFIKFWTWAKNDYDKNGVTMPVVGKIL